MRTLAYFKINNIDIYYQRLKTLKDSRNNWTHELISVDSSSSSEAIDLSESLFRDRFGFNSTLPAFVASSFVTGGEYTPPSTQPQFPKIQYERVYNKNRIHSDGLNKELKQALGDHITGFSAHASKIKVHFIEKATPEDEIIARKVIESHDPAFISIDDAHLYQRGEYQFDSDRTRPFIIGGSDRDSDQVTIMIELPHTTKTEVTVQIEGIHNPERIIQLANGKGTLQIFSREPVDRKITVTVPDHPCTPFEIEVKQP
ncbi:MAG: hypothetical protein K8I60_02145 [Anaerolineae bacterium]|nr:hypothetical protein [Anaerolineae bacterium]